MNIDEYVNSIIELTKNNTIIISEKEIQSDHIKLDDTTCGQLQKREFFYLSPPCYLNGKRAIAIMLFETGVVLPYFQGEEDDLRVTIYTSLMGYAIVKSFTIYQIAIDKFINDDKSNYILTTADNIYITTLSYVKLSGRFNGFMFMLFSTPLVAIKLPYTNALPRYSVLYVEGNEIKIIEVNDDIFKQILYKNYENAKKALQHTLESHPELARLVEQLEIY